MKKLLLLCALSFTLFSCKQEDPYPQGGVLVAEKPAIEPEPQSWGFDIDEVMDFKEGRKGQYKLKFTVPKPGKPIVSVENLPAGDVQFTEIAPGSYEFSWTPNYDAANESADPAIKQKLYEVKFWLRTTDNDVEARSFVSNLKVADTPRIFESNLVKSTALSEGEVRKLNFDLKNEDYPLGPYTVFIAENHNWARVESVDHDTFQLVLEPQYLLVKKDSSFSSSYKNFDMNVQIIARDGRKLAQKISVRVDDVRLRPEVLFPKELTGDHFLFNITAADLNGEGEPTITIANSSLPSFGDFSFVKQVLGSQNTVYPSASYLLSWKHIPLDYMNTTHTLQFNVCTKNTTCESKSLTLKLELAEEEPPKFHRETYPLGQVPPILFNSSKKFALKVTDASGSQLDLRKLMVRPKELKDKVIKLHQNEIEIVGSVEGFNQFSLVATSKLGTQSVEGFTFETLAKDWPKYLYLGYSQGDQELIMLQNVLGPVTYVYGTDSVKDERILMGKETLIIGTQTVNNSEYKATLEKLMARQKFKNILVSTPIIDSIPDKLMDELVNDLKIRVTGRFDQSHGSLSDYVITANHNSYPQSQKEVKLKGKTSIEAASPAFLRNYLDNPKCEYFLKLRTPKDSKFEEGIGYSCQRSSGLGRFVVMGFEYSDLDFQAGDKDLVGRWLKRSLGDPKSEGETK